MKIVLYTNEVGSVAAIYNFLFSGIISEDVQRSYFPKEIILQAVYFKLRFNLSYRDVEELINIRGIQVDHATIRRWVFKFTRLMETSFRKRKKPVRNS